MLIQAFGLLCRIVKAEVWSSTTAEMPEMKQEKQHQGNAEYSFDPYISGSSLPPDAFQEELTGKSLPEQVKFLKERGYTFRVISERLNVPMTNCYTAIKRFHLPKEYWDRIKTELRRKRRAREAAEENAVAKVLAKIPPFSKKQRLLDGIQNTFQGSSEVDDSNNITATSINVPIATSVRQGSPKTIQRKHLTHEDGKLVQYYRDQGLTLQKIAEKLQIPISSCYRILKRYQVSQKAGMIIGVKQSNSSHDQEFITTECSPTTKSTSELLLGMVDASMKSMPYPLNSKSPNQDLSTENIKSENNFIKSDQNLLTKSQSLFETDKNCQDVFHSKEIESGPENFTTWNNKNKCLICGVDVESLNAISYIKHMKLHQIQFGKVEIDNEKLSCMNEDDDIAPTLQPQSTSNLSQPQSPCLQPENFDIRSLPSTSASAIANISHVLQAIREKLEWASKEITTTTDPEKILGLMKVIASGLQILGQYATVPNK
uniref:C2H2-type domain-containing protein n=1 Tax=Syphacia muris TaxID=451379 RepID=A0A0N5AT39_9BILA